MNLPGRSEVEERVYNYLPTTSGLVARIWKLIFYFARRPLFVTTNGSTVRMYNEEGKRTFKASFPVSAASNSMIFQRDDRCFFLTLHVSTGRLFELLPHCDNSYRDCGQLQVPSADFCQSYRPLYSAFNDSIILISYEKDAPATRYSIPDRTLHTLTRNDNHIPARTGKLSTHLLYGSGRYFVSLWWDASYLLIRRIRVIDLATTEERVEVFQCGSAQEEEFLVQSDPRSVIFSFHCGSQSLIEIDIERWFRSFAGAPAPTRRLLLMAKDPGDPVRMLHHAGVYYETRCDEIELTLFRWEGKSQTLTPSAIATCPALDQLSVRTDGRNIYCEIIAADEPEDSYGVWVCEPLSLRTSLIRFETHEHYEEIYWTV